MRAFSIAALACILCLGASTCLADEAPRASNGSVAGRWLTEKHDGILLIEPKGAEYVGKLVWVKDRDGIKGPERLDMKNPNPELRSRRVLGLTILTGIPVTPDESGTYRGGRIYNPKSGKLIPIRLQLESPDVIKARVGTSLLHKTIRWTRVQSDTPEGS